LGDTKGHDKLCGRYNSRALQVKRVCRHCDIPTMDCDNAFYPWRHVKPDAVHYLVVSNDLEGLKAMSQHPQKNAFYNSKLGIGRNPRGIHGMTPGEPLHVLLDLGLFVVFSPPGSLRGLQTSWAHNPLTHEPAVTWCQAPIAVASH
jgi:hypothetical protein